MGRINLVRNSFLGGEIGKKSYGRTDLPQWNHCHEILQNVLSLPQGAAIRRPGFKFISNTLDNRPAACYPFAFSDTESYFVEVSKPASGSAIFKMIDASSFAVTSVGDTGVSIPEYADEDLDSLQISQVADVLWVTHADYPPWLIFRSFAAGVIEFFAEPAIEPLLSSVKFGYTTFHQFQPWRSVNTTTTKLKPAATTGATTIDAISPAASPVYMFVTEMIGSFYKITQTNAGNRYTGMAKITAMSGAAVGGKYAQVTVTVKDDFVNTTADDDWEESSWSAYRGYPRTVASFESRMYFGGNASEPDRIWASAIAAYFSLDARGSAAGAGFPSVTASTPFSFTPNSGSINLIEFLSAGKTLFAGTSQREYVCSGPDSSQSLSAENISESPETAHGSRYVQPQRVAYTVIAVQPTGRKLREYVFDFVSNSYEGTDIGLHAHHLLNDRVNKICWQEEPYGILWAKDDAGALISMTRERQQQILAWNSHEIGGTAAIVKSICVVPDDNGVRRLFAIIKRTISGSAYYSRECLVDTYEGETLTTFNSNCLDGHISATTATAKTAWAALAPHLVGETVKVVGCADANGTPNYLGEVIVGASGDVTSPVAVRDILVGVKYKSKIRTMRAEGGSAIGSAQGAMKRTDKILLRLFDCFGLSFGTRDGNQSEIIFWAGDHPETVTLFTGDKFLDFPNGWDRDGVVQLESEWPFPMGINFIVTRMTVNED